MSDGERNKAKARTVVVVAVLLILVSSPLAGAATWGRAYLPRPGTVVDLTPYASPVSPAASCSSGYATPWGDCLQGPWTPYPSVPTRTTDGGVFGAAGTQGPTGSVGPGAFPRGSPQITGTHPNGGAGVATQIGSNTVWGNTTVYLGGNVSWLGAYSLTIWDAKVIFNESTTSQAWQYGFNVTQTVSAGYTLTFRSGAIVVQSSASTRPWFIETQWYYHQNLYVSAQNSTFYVNGTNTAGLSQYQVQGGSYAHETGAVGFEVTVFQHSSFYEAYAPGQVPEDGLGYGNISTGSSQPTYPGPYVSFSYVQDALVYFIGGNDTFANSTVYADNEANSDSNVLFGHNWVYKLLDNDRVTGLSTDRWLATVSHLSSGQFDLWVNNSYVSGNVTNSTLWDYSTGGKVFITNSTFANVTVNTGPATTGNRDPETPSTSTNLQPGSANWDFIGGSTTSVVSTAVYHDTFANVTIYRGLSDLVDLSPAASATQYEAVNYSLFSGITDVAGALNAGDVTVVSETGEHASFYDNLITRFSTSIPASSYPIPYTPQLMLTTEGDTQTGLGFDISHSYAAGYVRVTNNWVVNDNSTAGVISVYNLGTGSSFANNTCINVNASNCLAVAIGSGGENYNFASNAAFGVYNYSVFDGSYNSGLAEGTVYTGETAYDVDSTSFAFTSVSSNETFNGMAGAWLLRNDNGTLPVVQPLEHLSGTSSAGPSPSWTRHAARVTFANDTISALVISALVSTYGELYRTVLPNDYNLTISNSFVPAQFTEWLGESGATQSQITLGGVARGASYTTLAPFSNPSFLNYTGYLGVYSGQTYLINSSGIKGETSLPVLLYTTATQAAAIPRTTGNGWVYTLNVESPSQIEIGANSTRAAAAKLSFSLTPGDSYSLEISNATTGAFVSAGAPTIAPQNGTLSATFSPALGAGPFIFTEHDLTSSGGGIILSTNPLLTADVLLAVLGLVSIVLVVWLYARRERPIN